MAKGDKKNNKAEVAAKLYCQFEECKKDSKKFGFCAEHYEWFMGGVLKGDGSKPTDFEEKLALYKKSHKSVA